MRALTFLAAAAAVLWVACGSGDDDTPTPTVTPAIPTATTPPANRSAVPGDDVLDLAAEQPATTVLAADTGDLENDLPALAMGDINGDGLSDLLIGARFGDGPDNSRAEGGEAYIIFGRSGLPATIDLAQSQADVTIYGARGIGGTNSNGDQFGFSGALGDVNGDGLDDIIIGAPFALQDVIAVAAGKVFVIFGRAEMPQTIDLASTPADATFVGAHTNSLFGDAVTTGDVNGDGTKDIMVGAPFQARPQGRDHAGQMAGAVFVFMGGSDLGGTRETGNNDYDAVIYGAEEFEGGDEAGDNLANGDLNNDGINDIVITAEAADGPDNDRSVAAEVYVVYGSTGLGGIMDIGAGDQDVTVYGADKNDTLGFNIGSADATGDGIDDLIVSLRGGDGPGNTAPEAGELHIFPGGSLPSTIDLADYPDDRYLYGPDSADFLGNGLTFADWDGDGALEMIVGAPMGDGPANDQITSGDTGEVRVLDVRGVTGGVPADSPPARLAVFGAAAGDGLGFSVATGDMNGDGRPELAILSPRYDGPGGSRLNAGGVFIVSS